MEIIIHDTPTIRDPAGNKYKQYIFDSVGWTGSILVLIAYVFSLERTTDFLFNTLGASGVLAVCVEKRVFQPIVLNVAWIIIGCYKYFFTNI